MWVKAAGAAAGQAKAKAAVLQSLLRLTDKTAILVV
jgi:hypothetical protein